MKLRLRPLIPGSLDPELLWGSLILLAASLGAAWLAFGLPTPLCPLHAWSGIPCPTCGSTRAAGSLLHGEIKAAFVWNPLMTVGFFGAAIYLCYAAVALTGRLPRLRIESLAPHEAHIIRVLAILLIAANWLYLLLAGRN